MCQLCHRWGIELISGFEGEAGWRREWDGVNPSDGGRFGGFWLWFVSLTASGEIRRLFLLGLKK
jgi:hypothetical protein